MTNSSQQLIVVAGGGWSTNVGNGFYNLGTLHLLETAYPDARIVLLSDHEGYWDFRHRRVPDNSLRFLDHISPDYLVLHGCFLTSSFPQMWNQTFNLLESRGTKLIFLSAGLMRYSDEEISVCRSFLEKHTPFIFISRDAITHSEFEDLIEVSYNGIDTAFFASEALPRIDLELPPYIITTFDKHPEPSLRIEDEFGKKRKRYGNNGLLPRQTRNFKFRGDRWITDFPMLRFLLSTRLGKFYPYIEAALLPKRRYKKKIGDLMIVRTDHQSNPWFVRKMYRAPNSFAWDLPEPYLALYANADLVLSDRVHACVAALAYNRPAMLFSGSPRSLILDRVGAKEIRRMPSLVNPDQLKAEKAQMIEFMRSIPLV